MFLLWNGGGWLIPLTTFLISGLMNVITNKLTGDNRYYDRHGFPVSMALLISALIISAATYYFHDKMIKEEGFLAYLKNHWFDNSFMFIHSFAWSVLLVIGSIYALINNGL